MTKRRKLQRSLWLTAALATAFLFITPVLHISPYRAVLFWLSVFLPQAVALIFQFREVRDRYVEMFRKSDEGLHFNAKAKSRPIRRTAAAFAANSFAILKCGGINPNRAGPVCIPT